MVVGHFQIDRPPPGISPELRPHFADHSQKLVRGLVELGGRIGQVGRPQLENAAHNSRTEPLGSVWSSIFIRSSESREIHCFSAEPDMGRISNRRPARWSW